MEDVRQEAASEILSADAGWPTSSPPRTVALATARRCGAGAEAAAEPGRVAVRWGGSGPRRRDAEIDEEIATHLQMAIRDRMECGESLEEARRGALLEF